MMLQPPTSGVYIKLISAMQYCRLAIHHTLPYQLTMVPLLSQYSRVKILHALTKPNVKNHTSLAIPGCHQRNGILWSLALLNTVDDWSLLSIEDTGTLIIKLTADMSGSRSLNAGHSSHRLLLLRNNSTYDL